MFCKYMIFEGNSEKKYSKLIYPGYLKSTVEEGRLTKAEGRRCIELYTEDHVTQ